MVVYLFVLFLLNRLFTFGSDEMPLLMSSKLYTMYQTMAAFQRIW